MVDFAKFGAIPPVLPWGELLKHRREIGQFGGAPELHRVFRVSWKDKRVYLGNPIGGSDEMIGRFSPPYTGEDNVLSAEEDLTDNLGDTSVGGVDITDAT